MNEFDRFVKHTLKVKCYMRYGDDFIFISSTLLLLKEQRRQAINFLEERLELEINNKNDIIIKTSRGIHFLGVRIYPKGRKLSKRNWNRIISRSNIENYSSYWGIVKKHCDSDKMRLFTWLGRTT